jgi:hypothetical protein
MKNFALIIVFLTIVTSDKLYANDALDPQPWVGEWVNIDAEKPFTTRLVITLNNKSMIVQGFGKCTPSDCDWGVTTFNLLTIDQSRDEAVGFACWELGYKDSYMVSRLRAGKLVIEQHSIYKDRSGRSNYSKTETFTKAENGSDARAWVGEWVNTNRATRSTTRFKITLKNQSLTIQGFGKCYPSDCDWGTTNLDLLNVGSRTEAPVGFAKWDPQYLVHYYILRLKAGRLVVESFNIYKDQSGRLNSSKTETFARLEEPVAASSAASLGNDDMKVEVANGQTVILGTYSWDIEKNQQRNASRQDLFWNQLTEKVKNLVPINGAGLTLSVNKAFESITREDLLGLSYSASSLPNSSLIPGVVFALRTSDGNVAKMRVIRYRDSHDFSFPETQQFGIADKAFYLGRPKYKNYHLEVEWVLYRKP